MAVGVCHPAGFLAGSAACGMKGSGKDDLALVVSDAPATAAGVFTRNAVVAAPVVVSRRQVAAGAARAIVTNSGFANACTGAPGLADAWSMVATAAEATGVDADQVLVASTGVIGPRLPIDAVTAGIRAAADRLSPDGGEPAAQAIRTTDAYPKLAQAEVTLAGVRARVGGMAKGAGMVRPDMATTLAQLTTDAAVPALELKQMLRAAADGSFNAISVDGCTSTNDCIFLLANGASGAAVAGAPRARAALAAALAEVALELAHHVVRDGEGATRVCTYLVSGAGDAEDAARAARAVAENVLVKCALHGGDPNWGRILAALGASGARLDPDRIEVAIGGVPVVAGGSGLAAESAARAALAAASVEVAVDLGMGEGSARVIASDLSPGYVAFNAGVTS